MIEANLIHGAHEAGVQRLMFLGSSCIYPRYCPQPIREDYLLTGPLEPTNEPYAIAKIAGIKLAESYNQQHGRQYVSVMPTNLYGPNDNYDLASSHVLPALLRKAHEARQRGDSHYTVWGSGTPRREFLYVDDHLADQHHLGAQWRRGQHRLHGLWSSQRGQLVVRSVHDEPDRPRFLRRRHQHLCAGLLLRSGPLPEGAP